MIVLICLHETVVWKMLLLYFSSRKLPFKNLLIIEIFQEICIKEQASVLLQTVLHFNMLVCAVKRTDRLSWLSRQVLATQVSVSPAAAVR